MESGSRFSKGRRVTWNQEVVFSDYEFKRLYIQRQGREPKYVDTIRTGDKVIGSIKDTILCSYEEDSDSEVLKLSRRNHYEAVEMNVLQKSYIENSFTTGSIAVFQQKVDKSGRYRVLFWNPHETDVYQYEPKDWLC